MKTSACILLLVYIPAVFSYSVLELTHDTLHFLADHYHSALHHHEHTHHHHLKDHHVHSHQHVHTAPALHDEDTKDAALQKVFYPPSYLERNQYFSFINPFSAITRRRARLLLIHFERTPPTPPPQAITV